MQSDTCNRCSGPSRCWKQDSPVEVDRNMFVKNLRNASKGSSPGPGGCTYEHLRVLMDDAGTFDLSVLRGRLQSGAGPSASGSLCSYGTGASLTTLAKVDGGVRGIATGCSLRVAYAHHSNTLCRRGLQTIQPPFSAFVGLGPRAESCDA